MILCVAGGIFEFFVALLRMYGKTDNVVKRMCNK